MTLASWSSVRFASFIEQMNDWLLRNLSWRSRILIWGEFKIPVSSGRSDGWPRIFLFLSACLPRLTPILPIAVVCTGQKCPSSQAFYNNLQVTLVLWPQPTDEPVAWSLLREPPQIYAPLLPFIILLIAIRGESSLLNEFTLEVAVVVVGRRRFLYPQLQQQQQQPVYSEQSSPGKIKFLVIFHTAFFDRYLNKYRPDTCHLNKYNINCTHAIKSRMGSECAINYHYCSSYQIKN